MSTILLLLTTLSADYSAEVAAARADYEALAATGDSGRRYLYTGHLADGDRVSVETALAFWMPYLSSGSVLQQQLPVRVPGTSMWRVNLHKLKWGRAAWIAVASEYPYNDYRGRDPLVLRADWLLSVTSDASDSETYYQLLYGGKVPRNKADFLAFWRIKAEDTKRFGTGVVVDRGKSGVSLDTRLMKHTPAATGYYWETFDGRDVFGEKDPLENLDGNFKFDAQELIASVLKFDLRSGQRCYTHAYLLTNGAGARQDEAPTDIVLDHTKFRGEPSVRTPGSCVMCHQHLNGPAESAVREWIKLGIELTAKQKAVRDELERFHLSEHGKLIERANEDFEIYCELTTGLGPAESVAAWRSAVERYDAPVSLETGAPEVYSDPDEIKSAIAYYSERIGPVAGVGRLASLAHGRTVSREVWEGNFKQPGVYHLAKEALKTWRSK